MATASSELQLIAIEKKISALREQQKSIKERAGSKILKDIVSLARKNKITAEEIAVAMAETKTPVKTATPKKAAKTAKKAGRTGDKRKVVEAKYRNPQDPSQTWTGRGISPVWVRELQSKGELDSAVIQKADAQAASV